MKFTVAIPAYKDVFLNHTINSVLQQTFDDFELIIVNDCSPYGVDKIVKSFNDKRIRYYVNERNIGALNVVDNWNKCLSYASGDYIVLLGDDDIMRKDYLAEFNTLIIKYPTSYVYHCRSLIINEEGKPFDITEPRPVKESLFSAILYRLRGRKQFISDYVFKTEILRERGGFVKFPLAWSSDNVSAYMMMDNGIVNTNETVFLYRSNQFSISSTGNIYEKIEAIDTECKWIFDKVSLNRQDNVDDEIMRKKILDELPIYKSKMYSLTIYENRNRSIWKNIKLLYRLRRKYNMSLSVFLNAYILIFKTKLRNEK